MLDTRPTGTPLVPTVPWGTHFCQFYNSTRDLLDQVVPYLKAGLENDEACVWVTSPPLDPTAAESALRAVLPDVDRYRERGQLHIAPYSEWYLQEGVFDRERVLAGWLAFLESALGRGFAGLRVTGNTAWLEKAGWTDFAAYEEAISGAIAGRPVLVLCTYALDRCGANEILDVVKNHDFAIVKRTERWEVIESRDRRELQIALRESEERYRALFTGSMIGIAVHEIVTDDSGRPVDYVFLDVNPAFEQLTGLEAEHVIGRRVTEVLPGIEQTDFIPTYGRVALTGEPCRFESYAAPLGRHYDVSSFSPRPGQFAAVFRDITEEKKAAHERERLYKETEEANRLKDEFLATLSHELRTPLNAVLGWSHLLVTGGLDSKTQQHAIEAIARNAQAQHALVADVLDVSRIITGKLRLITEEVDLTRLLDDAIAAVKPAADAKRLNLETSVSLPGNAARVTGDPDRIRQVLWNLLSNAVKFTPSGGSVRVEIRQVDSKLEVRVADTGIGIAPEFLPRVFERFTQGDGSASRHHGGLGLGLAIVRHLVELHGGDVTAESEGEGRGSVFSFRLPVRAVAAGSPVPDEPAPVTESQNDGAHHDLTGVRVLVVDDEVDARTLLEVVLAAAGATVLLAGSAREAIDILRSSSDVDVILGDIGMPEVDGYEMIGQIRSIGGRMASIPAVALTAYGRTEDRVRAIAAGYHQHVTKPATAADIVAAVWQARQVVSSE